MASELTLTLLRFGFLALLWIFVFVVLAGMRRDLGLGHVLRQASAGSRKDARSSASGTGNHRVQRAPQRPGQLFVADGPLAGSTVLLEDSPVVLGRGADCTVPLQDDYASTHHARLFAQGSRWFLEDLGSTNGTFVNGQRLSRATLVEPGVPFTVGRTVMELRA